MNRKFIMGVVGFLVFVFIMEWNAPKKFVWQPTYHHTDEQPFGCAVFDSIMNRSLPNRYSVIDKTLPQILTAKPAQPTTYIVTTSDFQATPIDRKAIAKLLQQGHNIIISAGSFSADSIPNIGNLAIEGNDSFDPRAVRASIEQLTILMDTLSWADQRPYTQRPFYAYRQMISGQVEDYRSEKEQLKQPCDTLLKAWITPAWNEDTLICEAYITDIKASKGHLYLCCVPLFFTNYGILDPQINPIIFRLMSQLGNTRIVRTEGYIPKTELNTETPLVFFLQQPPLRWAIYLTMLGLLLFFVFTAKRRQRAIPLQQQRENKALEFVQLIGTLYYQRHDNADLVRKKCNYFAETLRRTLQIDITAEEEQAEAARIISQHTGIANEEIASTLQSVNAYSANQERVSDKDMRQIINEIDNIIRQI